jgi:hypothetical protein
LRLADPFVQNHDLLFDGLEEGQLLSDKVLDSLVQLDVVLGNERDGLAGAARAGSSPNAVDVVFAVRRDVVVDDDVNVRNVQTSARGLNTQNLVQTSY